MKIVVTMEFDSKEEMLSTLGGGLAQLEGQPVKVVADGVVAGGEAKTPAATKKAATKKAAAKSKPEPEDITDFAAESAESEKTIDDCRNALSELMAASDNKTAMNVLKAYGVERISEVKPEDYEEFIAACIAKKSDSEESGAES